jgi:hypothetical protein
MKLPLQYQISEYDCAVASLINVVNYLYDREEIIPEIIKVIYEKTLDGYDGKIEHVGLGTSRIAMKKISELINDISSKNQFSLLVNYYEKEEVNLDIIKSTISDKGVVVIRTFEEYEHYVIITDINEEGVFLFNSYYETNPISKDKEITFISNRPFEYNTFVSFKRLEEITKNDFALGPIKGREAISFYRKNS